MKQLCVALFLILTGVFIVSNIYTLIPIYQDIAVGLDITFEQAVYGSSVFSLCYAFGLLSFGPISEKLGRKQVLVIGLLFSSISTAITGLAFNDSSFYLFRGIQGFALASFAPVAFAYTFDIFSERSRTLVLALINSGFLVAGIVGQLISSLFTLHLGWQFVFFGFAIIYGFLFIIGLKALPKSEHTTNSMNRRVVSEMLLVLKDKNLLQCYCITFTLLLSFVAYYDGLANYFTQVIIMNPDTLFLIRAFGLLGAILSIFTGRIIKTFGEKKTLAFGMCLAIASLLLLLFYRNPAFVCLSSVCFVAAISLLLPSVISVIGTIADSRRGIAISLYSFILLTGASIGPIIASRFTFSGLLTLLVGLFLINLFICRRVKIVRS